MENSNGWFDSAERKRRAEPTSEHVKRIGWLLLTLFFDGAAEYATYLDHCGMPKREFQRDLKKIREIGETRGFTVSRSRGGRVLLHSSAGRALSPLITADRDVTATLARIAGALGEPVRHELRAAVGDGPADMGTGFLHVRDALPSEGGRIAKTFDLLKRAAAGPARVAFSYTSRGAQRMRRVEPYHIVIRSGRYYLVGYDLDARDWRNFALDAIGSSVRNDGTFRPRAVPKRFLAERAIGWFSGSASTEVTVRFSALVAAAATSRRWHEDERVLALPDGGVEISLCVQDLNEAVRWALRFGAEAVVVAPPEAVALALKTLDRIATAYHGAASSKRTGLTGLIATHG